MIDIYPYYRQIWMQYYAVRAIMVAIIIVGWREWTVWMFVISNVPRLQRVTRFAKCHYITILMLWVFYLNNTYWFVAHSIVSCMIQRRTPAPRPLLIFYTIYFTVATITVCYYEPRSSVYIIIHCLFIIFNQLIVQNVVENWSAHMVNNTNIELWIFVAMMLHVPFMSLALIFAFELAMMAVPMNMNTSIVDMIVTYHGALRNK